MFMFVQISVRHQEIERKTDDIESIRQPRWESTKNGGKFEFFLLFSPILPPKACFTGLPQKERNFLFLALFEMILVLT